MSHSVLLVGKFSQSNGFCAELAERLTQTGWSTLTTSSVPGRLQRVADMVGSAWRRRREYEVAQVDVYSWDAFVWAEAVCWTLQRAGRPYVLTLHGGDLPRFTRRWPGRVRRLLQSAAAVTTPSGYLLDEMRSVRNDLRLLPNARDLGTCRVRVRSRPEPKLVWLRRFHWLYNPEMAPEVVRRLQVEHPSVHLTMVGPDSGDGTLESTRRVAAECGVFGRISFPGGVPKEQVPAWLEQGDVFLNTTDVDNTPLSVLEAMACGLCIVSTNVGGIPYLLEHEKDALLVPPRDPEAMAAAVRRVLEEPGLAERLSRSARAKVKQFDWQVILPQWDGLLRSVAGGCRA